MSLVNDQDSLCLIYIFCVSDGVTFFTVKWLLKLRKQRKAAKQVANALKTEEVDKSEPNRQNPNPTFSIDSEGYRTISLVPLNTRLTANSTVFGFKLHQ